MTPRTVLLLVPAFLLVASCAVRLGGPAPQEYRAMALEAEPGVTAAAMADRIRGANANLVLLSAARDSAWFAAVAEQARLQLSGPGYDGEVGMAFLAGEAVGDTTITLPLTSGDNLVVHDALYDVDRNRQLDLLITRIPAGLPLRPALDAFMSYYASDVMHNVAVLVAVQVENPAQGDTVSSLLRPAFFDIGECPRPAEVTLPAMPGIRLFYGPQVRITCERVRVLDAPGSPVLAHVVVLR